MKKAWLTLCVTMMAATGLAQSKPAEPALVVAGFTLAEGVDERDRWLAAAVEETLAWRLRRVGALVVVPTVRVHQAALELRDDESGPAPELTRVIGLLGAKRQLTGVCAGEPGALRLELTLLDESGGGAPKESRSSLPTGRLFDVLDEATRWSLGALGVAHIDAAIEKLIFGPPCATPGALEYYVKAVSAGRAGQMRDALFYVQQATDYDPLFRSAQSMLAQLELRGPPQMRAAAAARIRSLREIARDARDPWLEDEINLTHGTLELFTGAFEAARVHLELALNSASERGDRYGRIAALTLLGDLHVAWSAEARKGLDEAQRAAQEREKLKLAAEWQQKLLELLREIGDEVSLAPTANKLAMLLDKLEEPQKALQLHEFTLASAEKTGSKRGQATAWMFIGQARRRVGQLDGAIDAFQRCLALAEAGSRPAVLTAYAETLQESGRSAEALTQFEGAYEALTSGDDLAAQYRALRRIADVRRQLGQKAAAIEALRLALDIAHVLELPDKSDLQVALERWQSQP